MYRIIFVFVAAIAATFVFPAPEARAAGLEVMAGSSVSSSSRWTAAAFADITFEPLGETRVRMRPVATVGWVRRRNTTHDNLHHDVFVAGAGLRFEPDWHRTFASFQLGVAAGRTDALSSAGQFITSAGWRGDRVLVMLRHISNGRVFRGKNLGETMVLLGLRF